MKLLELYCENWTEKAAFMEPVIGRDEEIEALIGVLCRKNKNNPALIGEPGVGKTAIVEGFAQRLASGRVPLCLRGKRLMCLDLASLLAGTKYRGEFEERVRDILVEVRRSGNTILFIDELHNLVGAGSAEGAIDAANLLKPALGRGEVQLIGATTLDEYRKYIEKDAALERRFRPILVREPTENETRQILMGLRVGLEAHHRLHITQEAIDAAVSLSVRYLTDRFLPDKALDLLDDSMAKLWISPESGEERTLEEEKTQTERAMREALTAGHYEQAAKLRKRTQELQALLSARCRMRRPPAVTGEDVAKTVSAQTGIPIGRLQRGEERKLLNLRQELKKRIIGQDEAVEQAANAVLRGRMGLAEENRPAAAMLFMGPTGVGKTALCKALAEAVYGSADALIRLDMTEFMEPNAASKLIGAPPGYVGFEDGGILTEKVRRRPYCVVLFDELEKAHRDVTGLLLQIIDDGQLTDNLGRKVSFRNTIIVMTSNLGSREMGKSGLGFAGNSECEQIEKSLRDSFSPEFLGRIDSTVIFKKLSEQALEEIAQQLLDALCARAAKRGYSLIAEPDVAMYLAAKCENDHAGARSLRHRVQDEVENPVSGWLLEHGNRGTLEICVGAGKLVLREKTEEIPLQRA